MKHATTILKIAHQLFGLVLIGLLTIGCKKDQQFSISIENDKAGYDSLFFDDLVTDSRILSINLRSGEKRFSVTAHEPFIAQITAPGSDAAALMIVRPGAEKTILIDTADFRVKNSLPDSLLRYIRKSANAIFTEKSDDLFVKDNPVRVRELFDSLISSRTNLFNTKRSRLTAIDYDLLSYQNKADAYSFLFFYGRIVKRYPASDPFFNFIDRVDHTSPYARLLPNNILCKYEIEFLRTHDSIPDIETFLKFIEQKTPESTRDLVKAVYIKTVLERPENWPHHSMNFTAEHIKRVTELESGNRYLPMLLKATTPFLASQKGMLAFDFKGFTLDNRPFQLSDLAGKVVLIDTWATWCGPCIKQRPAMIHLAKKYKEDPRVNVLFVSIDTQVEKWKTYALKTNPDKVGTELVIPDGMDSEFCKRYAIRAIPRYMLIGKDGKIVHANMDEPAAEMERLLEEALAVK